MKERSGISCWHQYNCCFGFGEYILKLNTLSVDENLVEEDNDMEENLTVDKSLVSKSIFYTPQINGIESENACNNKHIHIVESKLLPAGTTKILPKTSLKRLKCDSCNYTTLRRCHLNEHYRYVHLKIKVVCDLCGKEFSNINQHMRVVHKVLRSGNLSKKQCQECFKEFYDLTKHMAKAHKLKYEYKYECNLCETQFSTKFILQRHMQRKHGSKTKCQECGKTVTNIGTHIQKMHRSCPQCQDKMTAEELKKHHCSRTQDQSDANNVVELAKTNDIEVDSSDDLLPGDVRSPTSQHKDVFNSESCSFDPVKTVSPQTEALDCDQNFVSDENIEFVVEDHIEEVVETNSGSNEVTEVILVEDIRESNDKGKGRKVSYKCNLCSYTTNRASNFNTHYKMVHLKSRTLCQLCGKEYSNISQHLRVVHKLLRSGRTERRGCEHCGHQFYDLAQHMRRAHADLVTARDCSCTICGEKFTKYANMLRHQQRVHQHVKVTCDICQKEVSNIDKHRKVHRRNEEKTSLKSDRSSQEISKGHYIVTQSKNISNGEGQNIIQLSGGQIIHLPKIPTVKTMNN